MLYDLIDCQNIYEKILNIKVEIFKHYIKLKNYDDLIISFFIKESIKIRKHDIEIKKFIKLLNNLERNYIITRINKENKKEFVLLKIFEESDYKKLAKIIYDINYHYNIKTIIYFEIILLKYLNLKINEKEIKIFKEELEKLNAENILNNYYTFDDYLKKIIIDIYIYSYICKIPINLDNIKDILSKFIELLNYNKDNIILKNFNKNINNNLIILEPYSISSIISIKIINFILYQMYLFNILEYILNEKTQKDFKELFSKYLKKFINDENLKKEIINIKSINEFTNFLHNQYSINNLDIFFKNEILLFQYLEQNKDTVDLFTKLFLSKKIQEENKKKKESNKGHLIYNIIIKLALNLVIYNYYYSFEIKEEFIDTYIEYIIYISTIININKKNFLMFNKFLKINLLSINKKLSPIKEESLDKESGNSNKKELELKEELSNEKSKRLKLSVKPTNIVKNKESKLLSSEEKILENIKDSIIKERKYKSLENKESKYKLLKEQKREYKSLENEENKYKSEENKKIIEILKNDERKKIILEILKDKIYRLIYYINVYNKNIEIDIDKIILSFEHSIKYLELYNNMYNKIKNSKNIIELIDLINYFNKENNINYYNYGSDIWILYKIYKKLTLEDIRKYVIKLKENKENKEYNLENYLIKIGYDLALYLYIFTNYSIDIERKELKELITKIQDIGKKEINKSYIKKINNYYEEMIEDSNNKKEILNIFNNDMYKKYPEQLKYNLYLYKYQLYEKEQIKLWFINNCILKLSN